VSEVVRTGTSPSPSSEAMNTLLRAIADDADSEGRRGLHSACGYGGLKCAQVLLVLLEAGVIELGTGFNSLYKLAVAGCPQH